MHYFGGHRDKYVEGIAAFEGNGFARRCAGAAEAPTAAQERDGRWFVEVAKALGRGWGFRHLPFLSTSG